MVDVCLKMFEKEYFEGKGSYYRKDEYTFGRTIDKFKNYLRQIRDLGYYRGKILDVGCAFGFFLRVCDQSGYEAYGTDISKYAIHKGKHSTNVPFIIADAQYLPFRKEVFDVVTMFSTIEHLPDPCKACSETWKVLKKAGLFYITTPNKIALQKMNPRLADQDITHINVLSPLKLWKVLKNAGFRDVSFFEGRSFYFPFIFRHEKTSSIKSRLEKHPFFKFFCRSFVIRAIKR